MIIKAILWDKNTPINGRDAVFLSEHFKNANGNDDRVLISYDGELSRIQLVNDREFSVEEKAHMQNLIAGGMDENQAIAATWERKAQAEYEQGLLQEELTKLREELTETDYKIIKCMEYQLAGLPAPYDVAQLHEARQAARDRINELEEA